MSPVRACSSWPLRLSWGFKIPLFIFSLLFFPTHAQGEKYIIKFATLAPEGSTWVNIMRRMDRELRRRTEGDVSFKIYPGGVSGDEKDVLRKIRIGQLHSAGFTGVGMGEIVPEVRILDTPFLFRNYAEVDFVYREFEAFFSERFSENGYVLLGWAEVGFIHVFTKEHFRNLQELQSLKMWVWQDDVVAQASFRAFDLRSIPLSIINVMNALQTNIVEGVYSTPLAAIALQWFTHVDYMMGVPIANSAGAMLISRKAFEKLPQRYRLILKELAKRYLADLNRALRRQNIDAAETLQDNGIEIIQAPDIVDLEAYYELGEAARKQLAGKYYSQDLLDRLETALRNYRRKLDGLLRFTGILFFDIRPSERAP